MINHQFPDAYKIGLAFGVTAKTVFGSDDLQSKLKSCLSVKGPELIGIKVDRCAIMDFSMKDFN